MPKGIIRTSTLKAVVKTKLLEDLARLRRKTKATEAEQINAALAAYIKGANEPPVWDKIDREYVKFRGNLQKLFTQ